ncbi:unnamed protein product [Miscanthus lutarioriparius]|uniref:Uncharacterized protein n=1 Tax=Miscanthus lutarioriparius TaxID=422564 RepID=A0A811SMP5_9POAL|nr:unnamed protein product [Miscanthus lutarioriparius]
MSGKKASEFSNEEEVIAEFDRLTRNAATVQRETLRRILDENAAVEYLQRHGLAGRTDPDTFRACVPLATHDDLEPYIARVADGDTFPVLTAKPITSISLRNRAFPVEGGGKALQFVYGSRQFTTKGGLTAATATTHLYRNEGYKAAVRDIQLPCCSPDEVVFAAADFAQSLYCHLLCGLLFAGEVRAVFAMFGHNLVLAFQTLERVWEELCHDIRHGALSPARVTEPALRRAVSALLAPPNPALADEVALRKIRHYAGGLPLVAMDYGASEGMVGANVEPEVPPESATFAVVPDIAYFEFIPLKTNDGGGAACTDTGTSYNTEADPVGLTEVTVGEHYEVVMTTFAGLYRYRLGDVVKVAGFYNSTPKLKFVSRGDIGPTLCINVDKNTELDVKLAVDGAAEILAARNTSLEVVDYTSHADVSSDPGHYVVFWELSGEADDDVLQRCCDELDRRFVDAGYVSSRRTRAIGPLELRVLRRGAFQKVLHHYLALGASANQFKFPRCVARSNSGVLQVLSDNAVKIFFSTAYD